MPQGPFNVLQQNIEGRSSVIGITTTSLVKSGAARIASVLVSNTSTTAAIVSFYDAASTASTATTNLLFSLAALSSATGTPKVDLNFPVFNGLVVVPGASTSVSVSFA